MAGEPEISLCQVHGKRLENIESGIARIEQYFTGTPEKRGLLMRMDILESFRSTCTRIIWILGGTVLTVLATAGVYGILTRLN